MTQPEIRAHARGTVTRMLCCDMHNTLCEQGGDECCENCTEATHYQLNHGGTRCVLKEQDGDG